VDKKALLDSLRNILILLFSFILLIVGLIFYGVKMPGKTFTGELTALGTEMEVSRDRLRGHVYSLAEEIGERHYEKRDALDKAALYIEQSFKDMGYNPLSEIYNSKLYRNIVVNLYGSKQRDEIIVIGAHYDSVWLSPGADDNASGISVLLELARALRQESLSRTVRLVAFTNEEWPFFGRDKMGSQVNARNAYDRSEQIIGMISLEMLGYYSMKENSQAYPRPLNYFYPDKGNFIAFVSNFTSRDLLRESILEFRRTSQFPSEGLIAPQFLVPDIRRSDNSSFWSHAYPAIMVTDTSNYRNRNYHKSTDLPESLDYESMARIVEGLRQTIIALTNK
jgi:hypothetical protein